MATIQDYLNKIKTAVYGKDVRQSIIDAIKQCYLDGKAGSIDLQARMDIESLSQAKANKTELPTKLSQLFNDMGFVKTSALPSIVQEAGNSESLIMSQKAVTQLVSDALEELQTIEYETVDSVDEMTDKSKQYILSSTGTLWSYTSKQVLVEHNAYDPNTASFNKRLNASAGAEKDLGGSLLLDYVEQVYDTNCVVTISGIDALVENYSSYFVVDYFDASKTWINQQKTSAYFGSFDGTLPVSFRPFKPSNGLSNTDNIAYIRIKLGIAIDGTSISASDCENLVVNFNTKNGYQEVTTWYDSNMTPEQATTNYVDLLMKINQNISSISNLEMQVANLSNDNENLTVPSVWQTAVEECINKIKALQVGKNCVTFPFFSDNHENVGYSGVLVAKVMKECGIPYCFYGGDTIGSGYIADEAAMVAQDKRFDSMMSYVPNGRFCRAVGNHDGFWKVSATEKYGYTREQVYELFLREESISQNKYFGEDGTYYYIDDIASKVRFVVLNTNPPIQVGAGSEIIDTTQLSWLQNTALSFNEDGWGVVFISHCPISNHYHANVTNASEVISVVNASGADIIGWYSGHIHRDRIYTYLTTNGTDGVEGDTDDSNGSASPLGFTEITITSDNTSIAYDDATKHTIAEDNQSHAIDFVTINKTTRTVNITRLGIGNDRSYTY